MAYVDGVSLLLRIIIIIVILLLKQHMLEETLRILLKHRSITFGIQNLDVSLNSMIRAVVNLKKTTNRWEDTRGITLEDVGVSGLQRSRYSLTKMQMHLLKVRVH